MGDNNFNPSSTTVPPGTTVTWTWAGSSVHNVTFSDVASANQATGSFQKAFPTAGTFNYNCTLHPGMNGTIRVQ